MNIYINENIKNKKIILDLINMYAHKHTIIVASELCSIISIKKSNCGLYIDFENKPLFPQVFLEKYHYIEVPKTKITEDILIINILNEAHIKEYYKLIDTYILNI